MFTVTVIAESVLRITDNLATALQATRLSAGEAIALAQKTVSCLSEMRDHEKFSELYKDTVKLQENLGIY